MVKVAFVLLCHKDPQGVIAQAERLSGQGDCVAIHFDRRAPESDFSLIKKAPQGNPNVCFAPSRVKCGWGEWSLVKATLDTLGAAVRAFPDATHFYLISGDCRPIKPAHFTKTRLAEGGVDYIEAVDFYTSNWIRTGMKEDRLRFRHFFNERTQKRLFYASLALQRRFGLTREVPEGIRMMIGSQWWCLRRSTVEALLAFLENRPDILRFFSTTWIPDETFFQTLVHHLVPDREIARRSPTFLMFTDYGMPVTFYNDHYDLLVQQDAFFARKISERALDLRQQLRDLWADPDAQFNVTDQGKRLHGFLTNKGRHGRRYGPRFWAEAKPEQRRELMLICCKKWHVAKRLVHMSREKFGYTGVEFPFNEGSCPMPDLGGIEETLDKRNRHKRAVVSLLFDSLQTDRLVMCLDLSEVDEMKDLFNAKMDVRLLEVACQYDDDYLIGHAKRLGLLSDEQDADLVASILPTLRSEIIYEHERIEAAPFGPVFRISETARTDENTTALASFFRVPSDDAKPVFENEDLFKD